MENLSPQTLPKPAYINSNSRPSRQFRLLALMIKPPTNMNSVSPAWQLNIRKRLPNNLTWQLIWSFLTPLPAILWSGLYSQEPDSGSLLINNMYFSFLPLFKPLLQPSLSFYYNNCQFLHLNDFSVRNQFKNSLLLSKVTLQKLEIDA